MSRRRVVDALAGRDNGPLFGVTWLPEELGPAIAAAEIGADFAFVPASGATMRRQVFALHAIDAAAFAAIPGPLTALAERDGLSGAMRRSVTEGLGLAADLSEMSETVERAVRDAVDAGADAIVIADDLAYESGWLLDPDFVQAVVVGLIADAIDAAVSSGIPLLFHSDGDVSRLYPDLRGAGFIGVHIASSSSDIAACIDAARFSGLLASGGVTAGDLLSHSPAAVSQQVARLADRGLRLVADDGGIVEPDQLSALGVVYGLLRREG